MALGRTYTKKWRMNDTEYSIKLKMGPQSGINKKATVRRAVRGEPHYASDTGRLYIFDGTSNVLFPTAREIVCFNGDVVTQNGEVVYL